VSSDRDERELFHFLFLEWLLRVTPATLVVLKGGVNLRFFHGSPRYSEDMDLDVDPAKLAVGTLKKNGYKILQDAGFRRVLRAADIVDLRVNDPKKAKHTETTQRFGLTLVLASGQELPTKVECSRRGVDTDGVAIERLDPEVARRHGRTAYQAAHYVAGAAARQKVVALAGRPHTQARDLFDLYLLDSRGDVADEDLARVNEDVRARAIDRARSLTYADFEGQVLEFLEDDARRTFASQQAFDGIQTSVVARLEQLQ
jgi:predicted nucleotidyltransferase component of viral defense system